MPETSHIVLLHATPVAMQPVQDAFECCWPAAETSHVLDDGLTVGRRKSLHLEQPLIERFGRLVDYALGTHPDGILITCSAFGPAIDQAAARTTTPIVRPNAAMFDAALSAGMRIGMVATFLPSVATMTSEFEILAARRPTATLRTVVAEGAMAALRAGDAATHDRLVAEAATQLSDCDAVMLAHFSTARSATATSDRISQPVFTAPDSAVIALRQQVERTGLSLPVR